jgi:hypothetical protein
MANIWNATLQPDNNVKQNTFDWTHVNNLTTQIGRITPIQCELVPAKTSFRVKPIPALQLMPMVFPVQTRMRASIAYFRYPLRALWKDYKDFIGNFREGLEEPYHDFNSQSMLDKMLKTGKLMDYLGVPTTLVGDYGSPSINGLRDPHTYFVPGNKIGNQGDFGYLPNIPIYNADTLKSFTNNGGDFEDSSFGVMLSRPQVASSSTHEKIIPFEQYTYDIPRTLSKDESLYLYYDVVVDANYFTTQIVQSFVNMIGATASYNSKEFTLSYVGHELLNTGESPNLTKTIRLSYSLPESLINELRVASKGSLDVFYIYNIFQTLGRKIAGNDTSWSFTFTSGYNLLFAGAVESPTTTGFSMELRPEIKSSQFTSYLKFSNSDSNDLTLATSPYYNSNSANKNAQLKLSAYAARAYEGIYNSVYRDNRNNPYYIDGVVQYNQWIPTYEGGADTFPYELRYANWEKDFLTTAVQSPQQGNAPLVGITTYDQVSATSDENGNPTQIKQTKVAMVDETGKRYSLEFESDDEELKGVKYVELDNGTTVRSARSLFDLVTSGISITDLRNVNAYQKFLELNMRKGYSYKEIVEGRFDVKVRYADLLLPEFFGGFSRDINMNAISQTVDNTTDGEGAYKDVLGSQAGVGYFRGGSDANIECFCDEESIIMGLLVITPLPVYTQLLPKHFLYRGLLDHFNPEFNNISFQPITYKEVCPIQAYNTNPTSLSETFGYQRPWYEFCQRYDQAHGLFRTDLSNFLMHRVFDQKPELAQSFLTIDPGQVTDVFSVTDVTDKVYGQILLDCTVKLPVARVAIPRLD